MDVMKRVGRVGMLAMMALATGADAEPVKHSPAQAEVKAPEELLPLKAGEVRNLKLSSVNRIAIADPDIADVHVTGAEVIQVKGIKKGETALLVWTHEGKMRKSYKVVVQ